jgi:hypothetical protein
MEILSEASQNSPGPIFGFDRNRAGLAYMRPLKDESYGDPFREKVDEQKTGKTSFKAQILMKN